MTVASCPSCRESVTVPIDALPESIVRCPLCHEDFRLEEFLSQLPPSLIVLNGIAAAAQDAAAEAPDDVPTLAAADEAAIESPRQADATDSDVPAFDFTPGSVDTQSADVQVDASPRPARRQKNPTWEVAKIVGGALLAVPAAQVILWWFVPGDWKRDLLGIGPSVSRVVPWIVPERFRAKPRAETESPTAQRRRSSDLRIERSAANSNQSRKSTMPEPGSGHDAATERPTRKTRKAKPKQRKVAARSSGAKSVENDGTTKTGKEPGDSAAKNASNRPSTGTPGTKVLGVKNAREYGFEDLRQALEAALIASAAWDTAADRSVRTQDQLTDQFYSEFVRLGETVTFIRPGDPRFRELVSTLHDLLVSFGRQPKKLAMIGNRAADWLDRNNRDSEGILLFGTVAQISQEGQVFKTDLDLGARKKRAVTIISRVDPKQFYATGDRILMLGSIVNDPAENLVGYEGNEPMVVMGGFGVPLGL